MKMLIDKKLATLGGLILLLGLGAGLTINRTPLDQFNTPDLELKTDEECELNSASCSTKLFTQSSISFAVEPHPINAVSPLTFTLETTHLTLNQAILYLSSLEMNLGRYRLKFTSRGENQYIATGHLPVCIRNKLQWQAEVWLETKYKGLIKVPYRFTVLSAEPAAALPF